MPKNTLAEARVRALRSRKCVYDIRDGELKGFGVRVLPSGRKRFFVDCQHRGERIWKIVGNAGTTDVGEARTRASAMLAAIRRDESTFPAGRDAPSTAYTGGFAATGPGATPSISWHSWRASSCGPDPESLYCPAVAIAHRQDFHHVR